MKTSEYSWQSEFPSAITVCDKNGDIIYMNKKSLKTFEKDGGEKLLGTNLLDCHPEPSKTKLKKMLQEGKVNSYTIEKNGIKKLIHQSPWFEEGEYKGFVEFSIEIPFNMPHFKRS
jgi:transcriptional regulator with PAS, ATPase and Fis domain